LLEVCSKCQDSTGIPEMSALREAFLVCLRVQAPDREGAVGAEARGGEGVRGKGGGQREETSRGGVCYVFVFGVRVRKGGRGRERCVRAHGRVRACVCVRMRVLMVCVDVVLFGVC